MFSGKRVLVTGASGFIGSHLCDRLRESGAEIHGISRVKRRDGQHGLRWWQGDLAELETVRNLFSAIRPDLIFHLASHVQGARDVEQVMPTFRSNLTSLVNLMVVGAEIGCERLVNTGSMEEPVSGDPQAVPRSPYAAAKWAGSAYARMFHALYGFPVVNTRVFMVYGPGQKDLNKLIPYVILSLLKGQAPTLTSGERRIDWIYVDDVVDGLLVAAQAPDLEGAAVEIGSGSLVAVRTVVEHLVDLVNPRIKPLFGARASRPFEHERVANTANTFARIGWEPKTLLGDGLTATVDWYRARFERNELG
jgi:UDP-glucose 4-epimerase